MSCRACQAGQTVGRNFCYPPGAHDLMQLELHGAELNAYRASCT